MYICFCGLHESTVMEATSTEHFESMARKADDVSKRAGTSKVKESESLNFITPILMAWTVLFSIFGLAWCKRL